MKETILYIWQLPQNLVGLVMTLIYKARAEFVAERDYRGVTLHYIPGFPGGISLGRYILLSYYYINYKGDTEKHEYGHCRQSRMLGPLYLLVIGLPSLIHAWLYKDPNPENYYKFWTEAWADRLGGVIR